MRSLSGASLQLQEEQWLSSVRSAGVLVLLQEAGDVQTVLSWGEAWLDLHAGQAHSRTKDVVLAVALAYCDLAAANLDKSTDSVLTCVDLMVAARALLQQHQTAPQLDVQISSAIQVGCMHSTWLHIGASAAPAYQATT